MSQTFVRTARWAEDFSFVRGPGTMLWVRGLVVRSCGDGLGVLGGECVCGRGFVDGWSDSGV